ncbi:VOC family protein [Caulobacter sp. BK020]|uniref:VOC family protein n=1 Tax=Caulobacter sp. BK020 TaxID=2512117 RepID=UPI00104B9E7B|nr:VOC family protein [Caulobacter sp. BK020]TCS10348.1 catechol 2,3-dioxygenase-like lactoylglutathione lyase family enzyme [Caulobacter sp. BK020]
MIDHVSLIVRDVAACKAFYDAAFAPLGIEILHHVSAEESGTVAYMGYGPRADGRSHQAGKPSFWIAGAETLDDAISSAPMHVAFVADTRAQVDAFHAAALAAGGVDNGAPGVRPHYHPNYYGAFVLDPDGRNIEAVCHAPA